MNNITRNYNNKFNKRKKIVCCNCGKIGHVYKKCLNPITSMGIILYKKDDLKSVKNKVSKKDWIKSINNFKKNDDKKIFKYLLIRRKDSLSFSDFVRVKYNINNITYIKKLLSDMTIDERNFLKTVKEPIEIWKKLWTQKKINLRMNEFHKIKNRLNKLINGLNVRDEIFTIKSLLNETDSKRTEPEWGFPKGRRLYKESDLTCAIREFCEETNIERCDIRIIRNIGPVEEIFTGSNNVLYKHIYYIAELKKEVNLEIKSHNQKAETSDIKWFSRNNIVNKLESINNKRIKIFKQVDNYLNSL